MKRRQFLSQSAAALSLVPLVKTGKDAPHRVPLFFAKKEEELLRGVLDHMLPSSPGSPGSESVRATEYLLSILSDPDVTASERKGMSDGLKRLYTFVSEKEPKGFSSLTAERKESLLREFTKEPRGEGWLSSLLIYGFEAMFGDPVYGANVGEAGWKWIAYTPGFPRPPKRKWLRR